MLRDRIVIGIRSPDIRQELLKMRKLSLTNCVNTCRTMEAATAQGSTLSTTGSVHKIFPKHRKSSDQKRDCKYCGGNHPFVKEKCPAYGKVCSKCGIKNHNEKMCRTKNMNFKHKPKYKVHQFKDINSDDDDNDWVYQIKDKKSVSCTMEVNKKSVKFQIDSGASVNMIPRRLVKTEIKPYRGVLSMWNNTIVKPEGLTIETVRNPKNQRNNSVEFVVFDDKQMNCAPILGLATSESMGLIKVQHKNFVRAIEISSYDSVFSNGLGELPGLQQLTVEKTARPVIMPDRRTPIALRSKLDEELKRLVKMKVLAPVNEPTPWVSQLVITQKKSGQIRVCIDPHELNKSLCREHYTLPVLEDILHTMKDAKYFSKADLSCGYWHVKLEEQSSYLTTFQTCFGRYRWLRLPFGLKVSSEIFQRKLLDVFRDLDGIVCIADDVLIFGKTKEEHYANLTSLLNACKTVGIKLNKEKMEIDVKQLTFMGHKITCDGLEVDPEKVDAIKNMKEPTNVEEVRRFVGMANFVARYVPHLTQVLHPLHNLMKNKVPFSWSESQQEAFDKVKKMLTEAPTLPYYNPDEELTIENDACEYGVGSALMQKDRPIAYASRSLSDVEQRYAQIEKEMLGVVFGLERFRHYTYGRKVIVVTDHKPLVAICAKPLSRAPKRLQSMLLKIQEYNFEVRYKPGKEIPVADTLSRAPTGKPTATEVVSINNIHLTSIKEDKLDEIRGATLNDATLKLLGEVILRGWPNDKQHVSETILPYYSFRDELTVHKGVILRAEQIVIPASLRESMKKKVHMGHLGINSCLRRARDLIFWPGMSTDIRNYVEKCGVCSTYQNKQPSESLYVRESTELPWQTVGTDLFHWADKNYMVTVDCASSFFELDYLPNTSSEMVVGKLKYHFARHGRPDHLISDNGPQFTSTVMKKMTQQWGIRHN